MSGVPARLKSMPLVERLGDVFLEVNAGEADGFVGDGGGVLLRVLGVGEEVESHDAA
jgi:hypothetical protein